MFLYSLYDSKASFYSKPVIFRNKFEAIRAIASEANDLKSQLNIHAADYSLFELGSWDEITGVISMHHALLNLGVVSEFKTPHNVSDIRKSQ